jgi:hypothetical protein
MSGDEALTLVGVELPLDQAETNRREMTALASRLGEWALLLKLVNGFLRDDVVKFRRPLSSAIVAVNGRLDAKGLVAFDAREGGDRSKAVALTIGVSLERLDGLGRGRFEELGIFPEDAHIPIGVVERLWRETGRVDQFETEDLLRRLTNSY